MMRVRTFAFGILAGAFGLSALIALVGSGTDPAPTAPPPYAWSTLENLVGRLTLETGHPCAWSNTKLTVSYGGWNIGRMRRGRAGFDLVPLERLAGDHSLAALDEARDITRLADRYFDATGRSVVQWSTLLRWSNECPGQTLEDRLCTVSTRTKPGRPSGRGLRRCPIGDGALRVARNVVRAVLYVRRPRRL